MVRLCNHHPQLRKKKQLINLDVLSGGIHVIRIPYQRVWRPDIILYNKYVSLNYHQSISHNEQLINYSTNSSAPLYSADAQYSSSVINTNVIVSDNGEVMIERTPSILYSSMMHYSLMNIS